MDYYAQDGCFVYCFAADGCAVDGCGCDEVINKKGLGVLYNIHVCTFSYSE